MATVCNPIWARPQTATVIQDSPFLVDRFLENEPVSVSYHRARTPASVPHDIDEYLRFITTRAFAGGAPTVDAATAAAAKALWRQLQSVLPRLPKPSVAPGADGRVAFTWDTNSDHLSVEVFPDGHVELFHEDMNSAELWGEEAVAGPLSDAALARLKKLE